MKKSRPILMFSVFVLATLACNSVLPQNQPGAFMEPTQQTTITLIAPEQDGIPLSEAEVPRISPEDAKIALDSGDAIIVDVRNPEAYTIEHVEGSINIPLGLFESDIANVSLEKDQWIITYCT